MIKHPNVVSEPDQLPKWEAYPRFDTEVSDHLQSEHSSSKTSQKQKAEYLQPLMANSPSQKKLKKSTAMKALHGSFVASELSDDDDAELEKLIESKTLQMQLLDSGRTSKASIVQKESVPKENTQKKFESLPFGRDLDRFKQNFKTAFNRRNSSSNLQTKSTVTNNQMSFLKAKYFGEVSNGSNKPAQANLLQAPKIFYTTASQSKSNISEGNTQHSQKQNESMAHLLRKSYQGLDQKSKGPAKKYPKVNESYDLANHSYSKMSKEQEHFQSLSINYGPHSKEFLVDEIHENSTYVTEAGYAKPHETVFTQVTKTQESYSYMPTDNSLMLPTNLMNVLENIEKDKSYGKKVDNYKLNKAQKSLDKFTSLIKKLESNKKEVKSIIKDGKMYPENKKVNASALNLHIETDPFGLDLDKKLSSDADESLNKRTFAIRHQLQINDSSEMGEKSEEDREATEGNNSSSNLNQEFDFEDDSPADKSTQAVKVVNKRWQNPSRNYRVSNVQNQQSYQEQQNQSCIVGSSSGAKVNIPKFRKYKPYTRSSDQKSFLSAMGNSSVEDDSVFEVNETKGTINEDSLSPLKAHISYLKQQNNRKFSRVKQEVKPDDSSILKQSIIMNINQIIAQNRQKRGDNPPRAKKRITKVTQLYLCYGEHLRTESKESKERPKSNLSYMRGDKRVVG